VLLFARSRRGGALRAATVATLLTVGLAGCGGAKIGGADASGSGGSGNCGTVNIAVNPWVGYEADAAVVAEVAKSKLGCNVQLKDLKEEVAWQGFSTGEVDAVLENWGHDDLKQKYIKDQKVAVEVGPTGNTGQIGWWVPPWMVTQYPDITSWKNLNKYADLFKTSESGGQGQLLDGDPSFVTNDAALVKNLQLNFKVVYAGSEAALITAFRQAEQNKTPLIGYFYSPQWFLSEVPLKKIALPTYAPGCDADAEKVACDYPDYDLDKIASAAFAKKNGPGYQLIKNFKWTNDDQNVVAKYIAEDKMSPEAAAKKWVAANPDKVKGWLPSS
jgi:glycine betaine/proline transport system substrate-binding protein